MPASVRARRETRARKPADRRKRLGEQMVAEGVTTPGEVATALLQQTASGRRLGELMVDLGSIDERVLATELAKQLGIECIDLGTETIDPTLASTLEGKIARQSLAIPIREEGAGLLVAFADPTDGLLIQRVQDLLGRPVIPAIAARTDLESVIAATYRALDGIESHVLTFEAAAPTLNIASIRQSTEIVADAPVVQVVNLLITQAFRDRASDIHIEPKEQAVRVRYRIDGALKDVLELPAVMASALASRVKVMAGLDIVERHRPQDGQIQMSVDDHSLDVRVSTTSTIYGEKIVLRLLDTSRSMQRLENLGMPVGVVDEFRQMIRSPFGMLLCAGPTGSGKTTTLYASLAEIAQDDRNVTTIEDPVEYVFPQANQIQIREQSGVTFANGLRSILRQDPDVILVGETRDVETARIATQAALTGHFVLSSVHATDAASAVHRFIDMGIEPFLIASSLLGVVGQRLVRRVCDACKVRYAPSPEELVYYTQSGGSKKTRFFKGEGCNLCAGTGFHGRIGVYEVMPIDGALKQMIIQKASHQDLREAAVAQGMSTIRDEAFALIDRDETTIGEVLRAVYML
jgi:type IV pilus assembly protein PilB